MKKIAFIGVGNMAGAILQGITADNSKCKLSYNDVVLFDINAEKVKPYIEKGARLASTAEEAAEAASFICLSIKPQQYAEVLSCIRRADLSLEGKTFISLAAGVDTASINLALGGGAAIVRTMPNTPLLVGKGVTALCRNSFVTDEAFDWVYDMFAASGSVLLLEESDMNKIIAATSSSIACFYRMISAICRGAEAQGLDTGVIRSSVAMAAAGAARMVTEHPELSLEDLIRMVTSYKGTTEQMMLTMDEKDFDGMMAEAVDRCTKRADELGNMLQEQITASAQNS